MVRRVATATLLAALACAQAQAGLPRRAGLAYAVAGQSQKALDAIAPDSKDNADRYFRAVALIETGRSMEGLAELQKLSAGSGAFAWAAVEKRVEYSFAMGRFKEIADTVTIPAGAKFIDPDAFNYRFGQSLHLAGRPREARGYLARVEDHRFEHYAQYTLAQIAYAEGDNSGAMEHLGKALDAVRFEPDREVRAALTDKIRLTRGRVVFQAAKDDPDISEENRDRLLKLAISQLTLVKQGSAFYAEALRTIGWCSVLMNDSVRALASFQTAMGIDPDNAHEDIWATGRMLERMGFYEEAASAYSQATSVARDQAGALGSRNLDWSKLLARLDSPEDPELTRKLNSLEEFLGEVAHDAAEARNAAQAREKRLNSFELNVQTVNASIGGIDQELEVMTGDLARYIDAMPSYALFPKKDRARILITLDAKERLQNQIKEVREAVAALSETRAYDRAAQARREELVKLWKRLDRADASLEKSELALLEAMKKRVSVREKELAGLLGERKAQNAELKAPVAASQKIVAEERKKLNDLSNKLRGLETRLAAAKAKTSALLADYGKLVEQQNAQILARFSKEVGRRADQFGLDEAQALHRLKAKQEEGGER